MAKTAQDVMQLIREQGIKMVDFKMVDINGQYRHVTIPAQNFTEATMTDGIGFDASNYGYAVVEKSDMVFIPDPATAQIDPFCEVSTLSMTGNAMIIDYPHNRPLDQYPRNIVLAAEQYMRDTGIADTMLILPEFEFYLFDDVAWKVAPNEIGMSLDAEQAHWKSAPLVYVRAGDTVYTYPIAGTRRRGRDAAEDAALAKDLKGDTKECAEHSMLVDLARNDIGRISEPGTVCVTKLRQIEYFSHVMHMVSEVVGKLKKGYTPMDVLRATFPAGTVSGAPKLRAMEIINELEPVKRNSYSGTVGYMDFCGNMDMCITLRTMRIENDDTAVIQSGAGIVADSVPEKEYQEILQKSKALFEVVEEVENDVVAFR